MNLPVWLGDTLDFPDPATSHWQGLIALGGDLSPERLLAAYQRGIFPWYGPDDPVMWWCPDPRAIFLPELFHLSRSLRKQLNKNTFVIRADTAFTKVVELCASVSRVGQDGSWIVPEMRAAYSRLHALGHAHSIEVWQSDPVFLGGTISGSSVHREDGLTLVGGVYGVLTGSVFCGESMFSLVTDASKTALAALMHFSRRQRIVAIDCQFMTSHLASLGAREIDRSDYIELLNRLPSLPDLITNWNTSFKSIFASQTWVEDLTKTLD